MHEESVVSARYAAAAQAVEPALCCATRYDDRLLAAIPAEVVDRDYGCGDPTPFARRGETVLDLGSGSGKVCYMLAQIVGPAGRVIGVDCNRDMLALSRRHLTNFAATVGYANVEFRAGMIQDLRLDLDRLDGELSANPIRDQAGWLALRQTEDRLREEQPLVADASIDCVVSNCVLNLVRRVDRERLFREICRVLKPGGRAAISDIVADSDVPDDLQRDGDLWSGCVSGAYREDRFLTAFLDAGFYGLRIVQRQSEPWQTVGDIEFRSMTVLAYKPVVGPRLELGQAAIYRGPFRRVEDDAGNSFSRGERTAICSATFTRLQHELYASEFALIERHPPLPADSAAPVAVNRSNHRAPDESRPGRNLALPTKNNCCGPDARCS